MGRRPKNYVPPEGTLFITCLKCGKEKEEGEFYMNKWSRLYNLNNHRVPFCKTCVQGLFDEYTKRYDEKTALIILCSALNMYYNPDIYNSVISQNNCFNFGWYLRTLQNTQYQHKSFENSITDGELGKIEKSKEETATKWSKKDKTNMDYVVSVVGYDPFEDCGMSDDDKKYCYNLMASYCDIDGIKDDGHKMVCCVQIVQNQLQVRKIDEEINQELSSGTFDEDKVKKLTDSKKRLQDGVAKIAQDNNISSKYNENSKRGKNTLSQKMKDMLEDGYESVRVNLFDIKTSEAIKQVADISNRSIMEQLGFDNNDYADMVKKQRELLVELQGKCDEMSEENRNLQNELNDLKASSGKKKAR